MRYTSVINGKLLTRITTIAALVWISAIVLYLKEPIYAQAEECTVSPEESTTEESIVTPPPENENSHPADGSAEQHPEESINVEIDNTPDTNTAENGTLSASSVPNGTDEVLPVNPDSETNDDSSANQFNSEIVSDLINNPEGSETGFETDQGTTAAEPFDPAAVTAEIPYDGTTVVTSASEPDPSVVLPDMAKPNGTADSETIEAEDEKSSDTSETPVMDMQELTQGIGAVNELPKGDESQKNLQAPYLRTTGAEVDGAKVYVPTISENNNAEDNTRILQEVLDLAKENTTGEQILVQVNQGTYQINSLNIYSNTALVLDTNTVFRRDSGSGNMIKIAADGISCTDINNVNISGGTWDGYTGDDTGRDCSSLFIISRASNITIKDLILMNCNSCHMVEMAGVNHVTIDNLVFKDCYKYTGSGGAGDPTEMEAIQISGSAVEKLYNNNVTITNCTFENVVSGIGVQGGAEQKDTDLIITGNTFDKTAGAAINVENVSGMSIERNIIRQNEAELPVIVLKSSDHIVIQDNTLEDVYAGIKLNNSSFNTIKDNQIKWLSGGKNIYLENNSSENRIEDNCFSSGMSCEQDGTSVNNILTNNYSFIGDWKKAGNEYIYVLDDRSYYRNCWREIEGSWYHFDENGYRATGWKDIGGHRFWFNDDGVQAKKTWKQIDGNWYYFKDNGQRATGWFDVNGKTFWFNEDGIQAKSTWRRIDGNWYYFKDNGQKATGWAEINGGRFWFDSDGKQAKNTWKEIGGYWYFFKSNGQPATGWYMVKDILFWFNNDGVQAKKTWKQIESHWYYFKDNGQRAIGWYKVNGTSFWFDKEGIQAKSTWKQISNNWYYFKDNGQCAKGWYKVNNVLFWFDSKGIQAKSTWKEIENYWYYFKDNGQFAKGWYSVKNILYWFDSNGRQAKNEWKTIDGDVYYFLKNGKFATDFALIDKEIYYFLSSGKRVNYSVTIDGIGFNFNSNGLLTEPLSARQFIAVIKKYVLSDMKERGILASLTAAQAILESGNGNSRLSKEACNLFGIKGTYNGESITLPTEEYINGIKQTVYAQFRKYDSWIESISDHSNLFNQLDRYSNLRGLKDYHLAARYVREDGYATDPLYTLSLINIIKQYGLSSLDGSSEGDSHGYYDVSITASALNIRSGPSSANGTLGLLYNGSVVSIDYVSNGWGRLADYPSGWIYMGYTKAF